MKVRTEEEDNMRRKKKLSEDTQNSYDKIFGLILKALGSHLRVLSLKSDVTGGCLKDVD